MALLRMLIKQFGLDKDRLQLEWISAGEGEKFQQTIRNFTAKIQELGPSPVRESKRGV
jgi:coenzyme F420-reducing hydrogenase delta subunit